MTTFLVRPFTEYLHRGSLSMLVVEGRIEGSRFILAAIGLDIPLLTSETGEDEYGPYARIDEQRQALPNGFQLRVEEEPDPINPGLAIDIYLEGEAHQEMSKRAEAAGYNFVGPMERSFSVYFNGLGMKNGSSGTYVADGKKPLVN